ncbi:YceI family protein [Phaeobacter sp. HF9A]|nr:YceI family protein [Phaeobacter sp. HF9A]
MAGLLFAQGAQAAPAAFRLDAQDSVVGFTYYLGGKATQGQMPVSAAELSLDLENIAASRIDVTLSPDHARAGFVIATEALKSASVLDARHYPDIRFVARRITGTLNGAEVTGDLTLRGVTKPVTLNAQLYRQRGTDVGELDHLAILLTGSLDRMAFGAEGYADLVGPQIDLRILAQVDRVKS